MTRHRTTHELGFRNRLEPEEVCERRSVLFHRGSRLTTKLARVRASEVAGLSLLELLPVVLHLPQLVEEGHQHLVPELVFL